MTSATLATIFRIVVGTVWIYAATFRDNKIAMFTLLWFLMLMIEAISYWLIKRRTP